MEEMYITNVKRSSTEITAVKKKKKEIKEIGM